MYFDYWIEKIKKRRRMVTAYESTEVEPESENIKEQLIAYQFIIDNEITLSQYLIK
jgi:hypothetical protein